MEKTAGTGEVLEIPAVEEAQISVKQQRTLVHFGFEDKLYHKLPIDFTEPSMKFGDVSRS